MPERLAGKVPPLLVEAAIGVALAFALVGVRLALAPLVGDRVPFMTVAVGMVLAALLAGWRSGLIALAVGQSLIWYAVVDPRWTWSISDPDASWGLVVTSAAQVIILLIIGLYQREVAKGVAERERRMELLNHAVAEIDHRTRNNYQTVLALVQLQAQRSDDPNIKMALNQVGERIGAIAAATAHLAPQAEDISSVRLAEHLGKLCDELKRGFASADRRIDCDFEDVTVSAEKATYLSIIVNELVTNALKHAFKEGDQGTIRVQAEHRGSGLELSVTDNGSGFPRKNGTKRGIGMKLVETFARQIGATHELMSSEQGTVHSIRLASLN